MKFFIRLASRDYPEKFPIYEHQIDKKGAYEEVFDETPEYNPETHRLGSYSHPEKVLSKESVPYFRTERELIEITEAERALDESQLLWEVREERNRFLSETDVDVLRILEERFLTAEDPIKRYRQALRDVTDPQKNGGASKPKDIQAKVKPWQK